MAELVDALDSKSSSSECGFDSHLEYLKALTEMLRPFLFPRYNIGTTIELELFQDDLIGIIFLKKVNYNQVVLV